MKTQDTINKMTQTILESVKGALRAGKFDKTFKAKVTALAGEGSVNVLYCSCLYTASSSIPCKEGDYVWVCAPCNNLQELFVLGKTKPEK